MKENFENEKEKSLYFHDMAQGSRTLELLLHTCFNNGIIPILAKNGQDKKMAYIILKVDYNHLNTIGKLIDITLEIPESEFNIKSHGKDIYAEISCLSQDDDQLFTSIKEIVEEATINKNTHNLTLMNTIYNISKIIYNIIDAEFIFATNETLYRQGKCGVSIYKEKQLNKINSKKEDNIDDVIKNLKEQATINLPTIFFCSFEQLRTFYFELDEVIYGKEDENDG
ncbi:MAG: hypothetical protein PUA73_00835 [Bacilli bacterium]|nr:hypothetical protein [Bacilli bacterium]